MFGPASAPIQTAMSLFRDGRLKEAGYAVVSGPGAAVLR